MTESDMAMVVIPEREARPASEGISHGANDKQDQGLRGQGFDKPACEKKRLAGMKEKQENIEGQEIIDPS